MRKLLTTLALVCGLAAPAAAQEVTLRAIAGWPVSYEFVTRFQRFIDRVNETGRGVVQIQLIGGPEVTPLQQQDTAIRNGVFDMQLGPAAFYHGVVPEADALYSSNISPVEAREAGAYEVLNRIWREKLNAVIVAWQSGGLGFHVYLTDPPRFTDGQLDLSGVSMRSASAYREWLDSLGATNVVITGPETFSAFERGIVQGLAWPETGFNDLGVTRFVNHRINHPVWQTDIIIIMNAGRWDSLSPEAQEIIRQAAIAHEIEAMESYRALADADTAQLIEAGVEMVELEGEMRDAYINHAHDVIWERLRARAPENFDELRAILYRE